MGFSELRICRSFSPQLRNRHICMRDAHCAELDEKSVLIFFFLHFQACHRPKMTKNIVVTQKWPDLHERYAMCWNEWNINFLIFGIFIFGDMIVQNLTVWLNKNSFPKIAQCSERIFLVLEFFFVIFSF